MHCTGAARTIQLQYLHLNYVTSLKTTSATPYRNTCLRAFDRTRFSRPTVLIETTRAKSAATSTLRRQNSHHNQTGYISVSARRCSQLGQHCVHHPRGVPSGGTVSWVLPLRAGTKGNATRPELFETEHDFPAFPLLQLRIPSKPQHN